MIDSGFFVAWICCNTFSAFVLVSCASTNITSCGPSMTTELVQNWSSEEVTTLIGNGGWLLAREACVKANATQLHNNNHLNESRHLAITLILLSRHPKWIQPAIARPI